MSGLFGLIAGTTGYRTARFLGDPKLFSGEGNPLLPGSEYDKVHQRVAEYVLKRTPVVQLAAVMNTELWKPAVAAPLRSDQGLSRPPHLWYALPRAVPDRSARFLKTNYPPL